MSSTVADSPVSNQERWVVCQLGARMHYAVPRMLNQAGKLERFDTDLYGGMSWAGVLRSLPSNLFGSSLRRLAGREAAGLPVEKVQARSIFGAQYYFRRSTAGDTNKMSAVHLWAGTTFGSQVVRQGFGKASAVYTFNTAALEILRAARAQGLFTVVEQTIVPRAVEDALLKEEHARHPNWEPAKVFGPAAALTAQREAEEWALADLIVCGSEFVREGIARCGGPVERCAVVPYGVDSHFGVTHTDRGSGPLRILTVGELGLRKGAATCLEVARALGSAAEFRWVGPSALSSQAMAELSSFIHLTGAVPRSDVRAHYEWADVFFLPSICEGSATVTYEALTCGLPVVTTLNAGSTVVDGKTGFLTPVRDVAAMVTRLRHLHEDRGMLKRMSEAALAHSVELSLDAYQHRLLGLLEQKFQQACSPVTLSYDRAKATKADVTAIMAASTREEKTLDSLKRILSCRPAPAEVLVHVDGGNERLAKRIREEHPEVQVLVSQTHLGPGGSRNRLLQAANYPHVASFDDDSFPVNSDYFAVITSEFQTYPHASILVAAVRDIQSPEGPPGKDTHRTASFIGCGSVYRKSAFFSTTGFVPLRLAYGMEELDLSMRLYANGGVMLHSPRLIVQHNTNLEHRNTREVNAAVVSNAALLVFLRYPPVLWPIGAAQVFRTVLALIKANRRRGILQGIANIPAHLFAHRAYRKTLGIREIISYIAFRRRCEYKAIPAGN